MRVLVAVVVCACKWWWLWLWWRSNSIQSKIIRLSSERHSQRVFLGDGGLQLLDLHVARLDFEVQVPVAILAPRGKSSERLVGDLPLMMFACRSKNKGSTRRILKTTLQVREFWVLVRLQFPAPRSSGVPISWDAVVRPGVPTVRQNGSRRPLRVPEYLTSREAGRIKRKLLQNGW